MFSIHELMYRCWLDGSGTVSLKPLLSLWCKKLVTSLAIIVRTLSCEDVFLPVLRNENACRVAPN